MAGTLDHRGPDDAGRWVDAAAGLALGHRRLSIIDLSATGHQPMTSACGRYVITYNGEIYNFREVRQILEQRGHRFRGHSDTEVLLAATTEWGIEQTLPACTACSPCAVGPRGAPADPRARPRRQEAAVLRLVRPNVPVRVRAEGPASSPRIRWRDRPRRARPARPARLGAGAVFDLSGHPQAAAGRAPQRRCRRWTSPRSRRSGRRRRRRGRRSSAVSGSFDEAVGALDTLLDAAVRARMIADVPLGALLSGGVDSSAVVALMQAASAMPCAPSRSAFGSRSTTRRRSPGRSRHISAPTTPSCTSGRRTVWRSCPGCRKCTTSRSPIRPRSRPPWSAGSPARTSPWRSRAMAGTSCSPAISAIAARWTWRRLQPWPAQARRAVEELAGAG